MVELLVTITIIGILAAMTLGALQSAREAGRQMATKATIAKLDSIMMDQYNSYFTRRVPVDLGGLSPRVAAKDRLWALRDLMRMEMPDRLADITNDPITLPSNTNKSVAKPALLDMYRAYYKSHPPGTSIPGKECAQAEMLYLIVSVGLPEAMEQFSQSEIGDTDGNGWSEFLDGWGRPIFFLRWAPGFPWGLALRYGSDMDHDPFDPQYVEPAATRMVPLIYTGGSDSDPGLLIQEKFWFAKNPDIYGNDYSTYITLGRPKGGDSYGGITNQYIEAR